MSDTKCTDLLTISEMKIMINSANKTIYKCWENIIMKKSVLKCKRGRHKQFDCTIIDVGSFGNRVKIRRNDNGKSYWIDSHYLLENE